MSDNQIYAFTENDVKIPNGYVQFLQAFEREDGGVDIHVRDPESRITIVALSVEERGALARALLGDPCE